MSAKGVNELDRIPKVVAEEAFRQLAEFLAHIVRVAHEPGLTRGSPGGDLMRMGLPLWSDEERDEAAQRVSLQAGSLRQSEYERTAHSLSAREIESLRANAPWNVAAEHLPTPLGELAKVTLKTLRARVANYLQEAAAGPAWERNRPQRKRGDEYRVQEVELSHAPPDTELLEVIEAGECSEEALHKFNDLTSLASNQGALILLAARDQVRRDGELNMAKVADKVGVSPQHIRVVLERLGGKSVG